MNFNKKTINIISLMISIIIYGSLILFLRVIYPSKILKNEKLDFENICVKIDEKNLNIINKNIDENNNFFMEIDNSEKMNIIDYNQEIIVNDNNTKEVFSIVEKKILTMEDFKSNINCNNELILYQKCGENEGKIRLIIAEKK